MLRIYQVKNVTMNNDVYFDNIIWYSNSGNVTYLGEKQEKVGIFKSDFEKMPESVFSGVANNTNFTPAMRGEDAINTYGNINFINYSGSLGFVKESDGNVAIKGSKGTATVEKLE